MRRWIPRSLIGRILLAEIATILLASALLWQTTAHLLSRTVDRFQERGLAAQALAVERGGQVDRAGRWSVALPSQLRPIYDTGYDGRAYALINSSGAVLVGSRFGQPEVWARAPLANVATLFHLGEVVGLSQPARISGRPVWIIVALNENGPGAIIDDVARTFLVDYAGILAGILLLLPLVNGLIVRRMVQAISDTSRHAGVIGTQALDRRLTEGGLPSEVAPLVHATNELLDRLEASFQRQSEFSANVAHELRTPLATIKAQLDEVTDETLRNRAIAQVDRATHILSQLRDLAALEQAQSGDLKPIDLVALAVDVLARVGHRAIGSGHGLAFEGEGEVMVAGNALLIELALINLIDNGLKHTPAGSNILVRVSSSGALVVKDDGPGVSSDGQIHPIRRFWRADWTRTDGAGLGLSIVQRIMEVHGGRLDAHSTVDGAEFCLEFRLAFSGP